MKSEFEWQYYGSLKLEGYLGTPLAAMAYPRMDGLSK